MNPMIAQAGVWIGAGALLLLYVSRRRKRKMTD
jgi:LPXTG-motif cell wall-anchored protein